MGDLIKGRVKGGRGYLYLDNANGDRPLNQGMDGEERTLVRPGTRFEADTFTCPHCCRVVLKNPARVRPRGYCAKCHATTCDQPGCNSNCNPIPLMVELQIAHPDIDVLARDADGFPTFDLERLKFSRKPR